MWRINKIISWFKWQWKWYVNLRWKYKQYIWLDFYRFVCGTYNIDPIFDNLFKIKHYAYIYYKDGNLIGKLPDEYLA